MFIRFLKDFNYIFIHMIIKNKKIIIIKKTIKKKLIKMENGFSCASAFSSLSK